MLPRGVFILVATAIGLSAATSFPSNTYSTYLRDHFTPLRLQPIPSGNIYLPGMRWLTRQGLRPPVLVLKLNPTATQ